MTTLDPSRIGTDTLAALNRELATLSTQERVA